MPRCQNAYEQIENQKDQNDDYLEARVLDWQVAANYVFVIGSTSRLAANQRRPKPNNRVDDNIATRGPQNRNTKNAQIDYVEDQIDPKLGYGRTPKQKDLLPYGHAVLF
jgi:hypothetical protein